MIAYLNFGLDVAGTVAAVTRLMKHRRPITQAQLSAALQPAVESLEATFKVAIPRRVIEDVCTAAVNAVNAMNATVDKDVDAA